MRAIRAISWIALFCLALVVFLGKADETSLPPNDSALHASVAMHATASGPVPRLPIEGVSGFNSRASGTFNDHPVTLFYLDGWIMRLFGPGAWSARLLPDLLAAGCVVLTAVLGLLLHSEIFGLASGLVLALTPEFIKMGANFHLDLPMIFFILLSFVFWLRRRPVAAGLASGFGVWIKTPVALLILPVAVLDSWVRGKLREERRALLGLWVSAFVATALLWVMTTAIGGWAVTRDYWRRQVWGTAIEGRGFHGSLDPFLFFKYVARHDIPWVFLLVVALAGIVWQRRWRERSVFLPALAVGVLVLAISPMRFKFDYYFLPAFPFLALLSMHAIDGWLERIQEGFYRGFPAFVLAVSAFLLVTPVALAPEAFPALRRFEALIQSYGSCADKVLFVDGYQPYGGANDYAIELAFYTGRELLPADCAGTSALAIRDDVKWVIVSGPNFPACLSPEVRGKFGATFQFGSQYLLSKEIPTGDEVDLTPLERDLRPVTDCRAAAPVRDRYR